MKRVHDHRPWFIASSLILSMVLLLGSCNQSGQQNKQSDNDKKSLALSEFKSNLKEIGDAITDAVNSDDTFAEKANDAIDNFETKLENFENKLKNNGQSISESTQQKLNELKQESRDLKQKLSELSGKSGGEARELKNNIKTELKKFGSNVKDFIKAND